MEVREIKALLVLMRDYGLVELEIEDKKGKVRLVRGGARASVEETEASSADHIPARVATSIKMASRHVEATTEEGAKAAGKIDLQPNQKLIESPMVGTFYRAASPDSAPFVEEGSSIRKGQPLCIIEAMKMMNEIESPAAGRVIRILAENGNPIEYGQPLMIIEVVSREAGRTPMFKKLLVANRGTIAIRIIRACRELGISTVAVFSTADKDALHVRIADESVCIGPPAAEDSYLNIPAILSAATTFGADAVHPGYGFLSENGDFAEACQRSGLSFVGPRARHIRLMGDKPRARRIMKKAGVPVLPGSEGTGVTELREAQADAKRLGYPVLIKAAAGGGGKGMRIVRDANELAHLFSLAQGESEASFSSRKMYLEKYMERARHVEFQILADNHRMAIHLGERDCSIQRRHQKVIEESPCPILTARLREKMGKAAVRAANVVGYSNVGTVEFLLSPAGEFYFIEMNTRIQVEHGVTEMVTGVDLVKESIAMAMGEPLAFKQRQVTFKGASMEFRIYAEDPERHIPSPGVVSNHHPPGGLGVRVETALYDGYRVPVHYDPLIAKLIVHAETRTEVIARAKAALREYVIDGIKTNIPLHLKILHDPDFNRGEFSTDFIRRYEPPAVEASPAPSPVSKAS